MESENEKTEINTKAHLQTCGLGLSFTRQAWTKLMAYCRATNLETSGFMLLERDGDLLWIDDIYLLQQESTGTSTEMDRTAIAKFQLDLYKKGIIGKKDSKKRLAHWHTHPTFNVFWSGTDMEMRRLNSQGVDYFVSIVVNQKGEALAAIDINGEFPLSINDLPIEIVDDFDDMIKACKAEVELKVKSPTRAWETTHNYGYHGAQGTMDIRGKTYWNAETNQWQDHEPAGRELPGLGNGDTPPHDYSDKPAADAAAKSAEKLKLLGPGDRRSRKAIARLERLTKRMAARAGKQSWGEWKKDQVLLDKAREAVYLASALHVAKTKVSDKQLCAGYEKDQDEISIIEMEPTSRDIITSDERGTYENIGGEIVKTEDASQIYYD